MKSLIWPALRRRFGRDFRNDLHRDQRGNVAMMVALSIVPLSLASMGALDVTRSVAAKVALQDALDAAALAAGRSSTTDPAALQALGQRILQQNLSGTQDFTVTSSSFTLSATGTVVASAQATFQPSMAGLFGVGPATLGASTEVTRANAMLEIALVLDNTGSMGQSLNSSGSKISYLQSAAANFVDTMSKASPQNATTHLVRISLVPFANMVRVDPSYATAVWMDQDHTSPINDEIFTTQQGKTLTLVDRFDLFKKLNTTWAGCLEMRKAPYDVTEVVPDPKDPASRFTPFFAPDESDTLPPGKKQTSPKTNKSGNNYVADPIAILDSQGNVVGDWWKAQGDIAKYATTPKGTLTTSFGPNAGCSMQMVHRLTTDFASLKSSISQMTPNGETNIPNGLFWGWMTLSPNDPFDDGVAYNAAKHKKIVVLMTDGDNTMMTDSSNYNNSTASAAGYIWQGRLPDPNSPTGAPLTDIASSGTTRTAALNAREKLICANMKDPKVNIEIYTIGVGVTDPTSKALLQSCASGADHYFDVTSATAIDAAFQSIANQIAQLHLSK